MSPPTTHPPHEPPTPVQDPERQRQRPEDAEREDPHLQERQGIGPDATTTTRSSSEDAKVAHQRGGEIDGQDGAREFPGRSVAPEGPLGTRDEDEPVLRQDDLEEEDAISGAGKLDQSSPGRGLRKKKERQIQLATFRTMPRTMARPQMRGRFHRTGVMEYGA